MTEYLYAQGLNWRQNPSGDWEWESSGGQWNVQELAPRVNVEVRALTWRQNPSDEREWQSEDGTWHPEEWAPVLGHEQIDLEQDAGASNSHGVRTITLLVAILGLLAVFVGLFIWISGNASYKNCQAVNGLTAPVLITNCTHNEAHIGMLILFAGLGALALSLLIRIADRVAA